MIESDDRCPIALSHANFHRDRRAGEHDVGIKCTPAPQYWLWEKRYSISQGATITNRREPAAMVRTASESISSQLESLFEGRSVAGLSDRQLLERFNAARGPAGEAAFAALVARHGPMVLNVCRQLLGDHHHAEDSFQAVFLVLARRAPSIRNPDLLGNWLYGVALRTARCAKAQLDRRRKKEEGDAMNLPGSGSSALAEPIAQPADQPILDREQAEAVHREIDRLPKSFRLPVVLCYFEGLTLDEAARRMRCPAGTLRSRLARARDKLRRALTLRGIVIARGGDGCVLESRAVNASVSSTLCNITTRAAIEFADGRIVSSAATALAGEVLRLVFVSRLKFIALSLLLLVGGVTGAGFLARGVNRQQREKDGPGRSAAAHRRQAGRSEAKAGPWSNVRGWPGARSKGQARAGCDRDGFRADEAGTTCRWARKRCSDRHRAREYKRIRPVPARRTAHIVDTKRRLHGHGPCARLRRRLEADRPRRRSAHR